MKNTILFLIFTILTILIFSSAPVSAHIPTYDPYGNISLDESFPDFPYQYNFAGKKVKLSSAEQDSLISTYKKDSIIVPTRFIKKFDFLLFFITSVFAFIYLGYVLASKNVKTLKAYGLSFLFQIVISVVIGLIGGLSHFATDGPIIAPFYDFAFFKQEYFWSIIIPAIITIILTFYLLRALLLFFKKDLPWKKRRTISFFYTLIFNPFFFPIGPLIGLMNLIYAQRTSQQEPSR